MTESPTTRVIVDSNVVIDVAGIPGKWANWSIRQCSSFSQLLINPIIYAELCSPCQSVSEADAMIDSLNLDLQELPKESLFLASKIYKKYRSRGGTKTSPLPDFFIGAHAAALGIPILTRDVARYRTYFPKVDLICP